MGQFDYLPIREIKMHNGISVCELALIETGDEAFIREFSRGLISKTYPELSKSFPAFVLGRVESYFNHPGLLFAREIPAREGMKGLNIDPFMLILEKDIAMYEVLKNYR